MKLGIVIPCYNRDNYLTQCLDSILQSYIPDDTLFILINDGSKDLLVSITLASFAQCTDALIFNKTNSGVHDCLLLGWDTAFANGCDVVMNLDSDAIVSKNWITNILALQRSHPNSIVSGFNTLSCDHETKEPRHPEVAVTPYYVFKNSIGGINMCFNERIYRGYVRNNLKPNWDWLLCHAMQNDKTPFVVTKPSVVQHIGTEGMHLINPDVAHDFVNN